MPVALKVPREDIRASILAFMGASTDLVAVVPVSRWLLDGADDQPTQSFADWIEPTILDIDDEPSRDNKEARVVVDIGVAVRPGVDMHRREEIASILAHEIASKLVPVYKHSQGASSTLWGHVRFGGSRFVNLGRVKGINRGTVTIEGRYTPS